MWQAVLAGAGMLAGAYGQYKAGQDAAGVAEQQAQITRQRLGIQQQQADVENIRKVRAQVRQARLARSAIIQGAVTSGTQGATGTVGGIFGIGTKTSGELNYFGGTVQRQNKDYTLQEQLGATQTEMGKIQANSAMFGAIGQLSGTIFTGSGGWDKLFGKS